MSILATIQHELEFNMPEHRANELAKAIFTAILPEIREYEREAAEDTLNSLADKFDEAGDVWTQWDVVATRLREEAGK